MRADVPGPLGEVHDEIHRGLHITFLPTSDTMTQRELERFTIVYSMRCLLAFGRLA